MSSKASNLREGALGRASHWVVGAVVAILGLSGVVVVPAVRVGSAEELLQAAEERAAQFASKRAELTVLEETGARLETEQAVRLLADFLPKEAREIELHSAARLSARSVGMTLDTIGIGESLDTGWPVLDQQIFASVLSLAGETKLAGLVQFTDTLQGLGYPCSVSEFSFTRDNPKSKTFKFRMVVHVYHAAERPAREVEDVEFDEDLP